MFRSLRKAFFGACPCRRTGTHPGSSPGQAFAGTCAGFTLIEVLVALAVVAASLTAIGALVAVSMRGTQSIGQRLAFRETLRGIVTSLPDRRDLDAGTTTGATGGFSWRIDIAPFIANFVDAQAPTPWQPEAVVVTVRSPSGQLLQINTIRLRRRPG